MNKNIRFVQGNEACVEGALYAGLDFFSGYPIAIKNREKESIVTIGILTGNELINTYTPLSIAANTVTGRTGLILLSIAARTL